MKLITWNELILFLTNCHFQVILIEQLYKFKFNVYLQYIISTTFFSLLWNMLQELPLFTHISRLFHIFTTNTLMRWSDRNINTTVVTWDDNHTQNCNAHIYTRSRRVMHLGLFVRLSVCLSVRVRNSKTIAPIDLFFLREKEYTRGSVLL